MKNFEDLIIREQIKRIIDEQTSNSEFVYDLIKRIMEDKNEK